MLERKIFKNPVPYNAAKVFRKRYLVVYSSIILFSVISVLAFSFFINSLVDTSSKSEIIFYDNFNGHKNGESITVSGKWSIETNLSNAISAKIQRWYFYQDSLFNLAYIPADYTLEKGQLPPDDMVVTGDGKLDNAVLSVRIKPQAIGAVGVVFRYSDPLNFYCAYSYKDNENGDIKYIVFKKVNGKYTQLGTGSQKDPNDNYEKRFYTLAMEIDDSTFILFANDNQVVSVKDSTFTHGKVGLYTWPQSSSYFDDFKVEG